MRFTFLFQLVFLLFRGSAQPDFKTGQIETRQFVTEIPYEWKNDKILIEAEIAGRRGIFLLDTGAPTLLFKQFFETTNLPISGMIDVVDANNVTNEMPYTYIPKVELHGLIFTDIPALIIDFQGSPLSCESDQIAGFIGSNQLKDLTIQFNLRNNKVILTDRISALSLKTRGISFDTDSGNQPILNIRIAGQKSKAMFDTGYNGLFSLDESTFLEYASQFEKMTKAFGVGTTGQMGIYGNQEIPKKQLLLQIPKIKISGHTLQNIYTIPSPGKSSLIGTKLLLRSTITIDYKNRKFYLEDVESEQSAYTNFGFEIGLNKDQLWEIAVVYNGTPAHSKGVRSHQQILKVNDLDLSAVPHCQTAEELKKILDLEKIIQLWLKDENGNIGPVSLEKIIYE